MAVVFLGLGANLGNRRKQLPAAVKGLCADGQVRLRAASSLYQTQPVGGRSQPDFLNAVVKVETLLSARTLLQRALALEAAAGRLRTQAQAPRQLDIDLLLYEQMIINEPGLQIPHPRMAERAFVLYPLIEIAPQVHHPLLSKTMAELAANLSPGGVERLPGGSSWVEPDKE